MKSLYKSLFLVYNLFQVLKHGIVTLLGLSFLEKRKMGNATILLNENYHTKRYYVAINDAFKLIEKYDFKLYRRLINSPLLIINMPLNGYSKWVRGSKLFYIDCSQIERYCPDRMFVPKIALILISAVTYLRIDKYIIFFPKDGLRRTKLICVNEEIRFAEKLSKDCEIHLLIDELTEKFQEINRHS